MSHVPVYRDGGAHARGFTHDCDTGVTLNNDTVVRRAKNVE